MTTAGNAVPAGPAAAVPVVRDLGRVAWERIEPMMRAFNAARTPATADEIWLLEHPPVYTLGRAASMTHVHRPGDIPVLRAERGGEVTYHGPGQAVCYPLVDLRRRHFGARAFVECIEAATLAFLIGCGVDAVLRPGAPGVYVRAHDADGSIHPGAKIASIGIRISAGFSWHGVALNVDMDLEPFTRIDPCGYPGLAVTDLGTVLGAHGGTLTGTVAGQPLGAAVPMAFARHLAQAIAARGA